jgi:hypothetical protein
MLATEAVRPGAGVDVFARALDLITETQLESAAA